VLSEFGEPEVVTMAKTIDAIIPHVSRESSGAGDWRVCGVAISPCSVAEVTPLRPESLGRAHSTLVPYISPSGSAMSSRRAPLGSRK
jgi:hypothetical protein